jgi:DNA-binding transcriptional regulator PaaX
LFGSRKIEQLQREFARHQSNDGRRNSDLRRRIHAVEQQQIVDLEVVNEIDRELQSTRDQVYRLTAWSDAYRSAIDEVAKTLHKQKRRNVLHSQALLPTSYSSPVLATNH